MERLSPAALPRRAWIWPLTGLVLLLLGPSALAHVVSAVSSLLMWPVTRSLEISGNGYEIANLQLLLIYVVVVLGMNVFFQTGLFSLGHTVFFLIGAYTVGILTVNHGVSFWPALLAGAALAGLVGAVLGLPAGRLGAFTFAMITLGYGIVAGDLLLDWDSVTGGGEGVLGIDRPEPFGDKETFYWLCAIAVALAFVASRNLMRSPYGRSAKAIESSEVAARSLGVDPARVKVRSFAISAVFAGTAGGLFAPMQGLLGPSSFNVNLAILFLLMVLLGGAGTVAGPIIGAVLLFRLPLAIESVTDNPGDISLLAYGVVLIASIYVVPRGLMSAWWRVRNRLGARRRRNAPVREAPVGEAPVGEAPARETPVRETLVRETPAEPGRLDEVVVPVAADGPPVRVKDVRLALGGVKALDGAGLEVAPGTVHALIGPNGSGKTTLLNVISGYVTPDAGELEIAGRPGLGVPAHRRASYGVARTFQTPYVFEGVSCVENVVVALDAGRRRGLLGHLIGLPGARRAERERRKEAGDLLAATGLAHRADDDAAGLPPGERRLLELARVLALRPRLVLMDEPAGGLNAAEIRRLERYVGALRAAGIAVLLVEHRIDLVMRLADRVTVLEFGRDISHGSPAEVRRDPKVISAYLGEDLAAAQGQATGGGDS